MEDKRSLFRQGFRDGIPIGLGYFAVAVSLGIAARDYGINAVQGFISSLFTSASAGQYMGFALYGANAALAELVILTFIINSRYILMGFALNQRFPAGTPLGRRLLVSSCITDEIFGITIARPGVPTPYYSLAALSFAAPMWALGTATGIAMGNLLPSRIVSAFSVALFGMFIAVIIPPSRKDKAALGAVITSFALSYASQRLPYISDLSQGNRTIILTILICTLFALLFPRAGDDASAGGNAKGGEADA